MKNESEASGYPARKGTIGEPFSLRKVKVTQAPLSDQGTKNLGAWTVLLERCIFEKGLGPI
jgi:hypothetical protein